MLGTERQRAGARPPLLAILSTERMIARRSRHLPAQGPLQTSPTDRASPVGLFSSAPPDSLQAKNQRGGVARPRHTACRQRGWADPGSHTLPAEQH